MLNTMSSEYILMVVHNLENAELVKMLPDCSCDFQTSKLLAIILGVSFLSKSPMK